LIFRGRENHRNRLGRSGEDRGRTGAHSGIQTRARCRGGGSRGVEGRHHWVSRGHCHSKDFVVSYWLFISYLQCHDTGDWVTTNSSRRASSCIEHVAVGWSLIPVVRTRLVMK